MFNSVFGLNVLFAISWISKDVVKSVVVCRLKFKMVGRYLAADEKWLFQSECCGLCEAVPNTEEVVLVVWEPQEIA